MVHVRMSACGAVVSLGVGRRAGVLSCLGCLLPYSALDAGCQQTWQPSRVSQRALRARGRQREYEAHPAEGTLELCLRSSSLFSPLYSLLPALSTLLPPLSSLLFQISSHLALTPEVRACRHEHSGSLVKHQLKLPREPC